MGLIVCVIIHGGPCLIYRFWIGAILSPLICRRQTPPLKSSAVLDHIDVLTYILVISIRRMGFVRDSGTIISGTIDLKYTTTICSILLFLIVGTQACSTIHPPKALLTMDTFPLEGDSADLNIPDRSWADSRPDTNIGWCGETGIQMAMRYYGRQVTQERVNRAGKPDHPDLYMYNIDDALNALSVIYIAWDPSSKDVIEFINWIKAHISLGYPVFCGIKIYPDEHPDWSLDHFILAVGYDARGLIINTNLDMDGQKMLSYKQLSSGKAGYSFQNKFNKYFARAITGVR